MDENRYNTRVRCAVSDKLIECHNMKRNFENRREWILQHIKETGNSITYREYTNLMSESCEIEKKLETLRVAINVWDQARDLCMDIADEICKEE